MMNDFRPRRFEILPYIIKNLLIINGLAYLAKTTFGFFADDVINQYLALHSLHSEYFKIYQLVTHLFIHADFGHLFFNMFALWMFGSALENVFGSKRFLTFYFICGIGAALCHLAFLWYEQNTYLQTMQSQMSSLNLNEQSLLIEHMKDVIDVPTVGASGAVFGCLAAFGYLFPNSYLYIYFLIPIKTKWFVTAYIAIELIYVLMSHTDQLAGDSIARIAHLGGALIGLILVYLDSKKNNNWRF